MKKINRRNYFRSYLIIKHYLTNLYNKIIEEVLLTLSSGVAFNFLFSLIPFSLILLTFVGLYLDRAVVAEYIDTQLKNLLPLPPETQNKFISEVLLRVQQLTQNTLLTGIIGFSGLLWTSSGLFSSMRDVLNIVYEFKDEKSFLYAKLRDFLFVFVSIIIFLISFLITSFSQLFKLRSEIFGFEFDFTGFQNLIVIFISFIFSLFLFILLYSKIPHFRTPKKTLYFSSFMAAIFFEIFKYFFTFYVIGITDYSMIYGAFSAFVIGFLWIYCISVIFTLCAALGKIHLDRNKLKIIPK
ncbi:MAG: YihY/virulence factor BrkB family protein [Ignavibacteria bacterium]|nr:YihY/virulence factor BrkB family protein [Ignavibacteria bacterium]